MNAVKLWQGLRTSLIWLGVAGLYLFITLIESGLGIPVISIWIWLILVRQMRLGVKVLTAVLLAVLLGVLYLLPSGELFAWLLLISSSLDTNWMRRKRSRRLLGLLAMTLAIFIGIRISIPWPRMFLSSFLSFGIILGWQWLLKFKSRKVKYL